MDRMGFPVTRIPVAGTRRLENLSHVQRAMSCSEKRICSRQRNRNENESNDNKKCLNSVIVMPYKNHCGEERKKRKGGSLFWKPLMFSHVLESVNAHFVF